MYQTSSVKQEAVRNVQVKPTARSFLPLPAAHRQKKSGTSVLTENARSLRPKARGSEIRYSSKDVREWNVHHFAGRLAKLGRKKQKMRVCPALIATVIFRLILMSRRQMKPAVITGKLIGLSN